MEKAKRDAIFTAIAQVEQEISENLTNLQNGMAVAQALMAQLRNELSES